MSRAMRIVERAVYVGPSIYARVPVIRLDVDLGDLGDWPSGRLGPEFAEALLAALPTLAAQEGFPQRLRTGMALSEVLQHMALAVQTMAGEDVQFGTTLTGNEAPPGMDRVIYAYTQREEGLAAGELALRLLTALLPPELHTDAQPDDGWHWDTARIDYIHYAQRRALGPSTAALVNAAQARGIPWLRLDMHSLIQFGHGRYQQRIQAALTGRTPHLAVELASDKEATNHLLAGLGLPVPQQRLVTTLEGAVRAARMLGGTVVTKPYNGNHGRGISIGLSSPEQIAAGFDAAREHARSVIVETYIAGHDHRLLVVNGELIAATRRTPGHVVGDGVADIAELVDRVNADPRRGIGHENVLTQLELDEQADAMLERAGYGHFSVPAAGEVVYLRATANLSTGGTATDVTDLVHPDNRDMAVRAVRAIGLDVAGVDFISPDIARSHREVGGAICEINAAPGLRMHVAPSEGRPSEVAGPVLDMLFPPGTPSRVPIAALTGTNGKTTTVRMLAHIAKMAGHVPGMTSTDGVYIDGARTVEGDMTGPLAARMVLGDPQIDIALLETARGGLLRAGLGVPEVDVGAVLNVAGDHLGAHGVDTLEQLARVKRIVVEVARDCAVLNADDPLVLRMSAHTDARSVCYVTTNPSHPLVRAHIRAGGRACALEGGVNGQMITLYDKGTHIPLLWTHLIPATLEGRATHNVSNAMFAAAMAFALGLKLDAIRQGLRTFDSTFFQSPGRMNLFEEHPFKVLMDYAHNAHAAATMTDLARRMDVEGRRIVVLSAPGDRRDTDIDAVAHAVAGQFDHYLLRRDDALRGRGADEVPQRLAHALRAAGVDAASIEVIPDEQQAVDAALRMGRPGDLLLIFADQLSRTWKQITRFRAEGSAAPSASVHAAPAHDDNASAPLPDGVVQDARGLVFRREDA